MVIESGVDRTPGCVPSMKWVNGVRLPPDPADGT